MSNLREEYFDWMYSMVCYNRFAEENSYRKLLYFLHSVEYRWKLPDDENRTEDGEEGLRWTFAYENHIDIGDELDGPCSVLEMILGLAYRCEDIMSDPAVGDRTVQWFWRMITNLGLGGMTDNNFDEEEADRIVERFLDRRYTHDGHGGLFVVPHAEEDLRDVSTWTQMLWYLNRIM